MKSANRKNLFIFYVSPFPEQQGPHEDVPESRGCMSQAAGTPAQQYMLTMNASSAIKNEAPASAVAHKN